MLERVITAVLNGAAAVAQPALLLALTVSGVAVIAG
jgi:hypothetical protein